MTLKFDQMICPKCGAVAAADFVDNGVGMQQSGPYGCEACGWVEDTSWLDELLPLDSENETNDFCARGEHMPGVTR